MAGGAETGGVGRVWEGRGGSHAAARRRRAGGSRAARPARWMDMHAGGRGPHAPADELNVGPTVALERVGDGGQVLVQVGRRRHAPQVYVQQVEPGLVVRQRDVHALLKAPAFGGGGGAAGVGGGETGQWHRSIEKAGL